MENGNQIRPGHRINLLEGREQDAKIRGISELYRHDKGGESIFTGISKGRPAHLAEGGDHRPIPVGGMHQKTRITISVK